MCCTTCCGASTKSLSAHNRTRVDLTSGPVEQRSQPYPLSALQQLVRNAVLHRTYEATNAPVRIYWYDDRIEITSPGGVFGIVRPENFGKPGVTDYRNPDLAEAMRVLGFVQHFGVGIPTAPGVGEKRQSPARVRCAAFLCRGHCEAGIMKTIALLTHVGGGVKTSLVYHLAWMYAELGLSVVAADLDLMTNLTSMFVEDERLDVLWPDHSHKKTILGAIQPLLEGTVDVVPPHVENISNRIGLLLGDPGLLAWEDELAGQWHDCLDGKPRAFRVLSAIWRVIEQAAMERDASLVLIDVGLNLGAVNRARIDRRRARRVPAGS